jgi:WD40 repeat protein
MKQGRNTCPIMAACMLTVVFVTFRLAWPQTTAPILTVETGSHTAPITDMAIDAANHYLVTASFDKTVRVWGISSGGDLVPTRILRPPIDFGQEGALFTVGITPDGNTIACGGHTGRDWEGTASIYLFDRGTGAMVRRLSGLSGDVGHLTYSPDGRLLAVAMKNGLKLYSVPDYTLLAKDISHGSYGGKSFWANFDSTGSKLATSSVDGHVRLYDLRGVGARETGAIELAPASMIRLLGIKRPAAVVFSPNGSRLAVGSLDSRNVEILDLHGNELHYSFSPDTSGVNSKAPMHTVAWSVDGRVLYAGGLYRMKGTSQIRKWVDEGRGRYTDLAAADWRIHQILPLRKGGMAYCATDPAIGIYDDKDVRRSFEGAQIADYRGNTKGLLLSSDGLTVQFQYQAKGRSVAVFSVEKRTLTDISTSIWGSLKAAVSLKPPVTDGLNVTDWWFPLSPKLNGKLIPLGPHMRSHCLAIMPDHSGFALGVSLGLRFFNRTGVEIWRVSLSSIPEALNTNGKVLLAALQDGTVRWYRVSDGKELLALFPHKDRKRWVVWTPTGYYHASPGGEDLIGWHVNHGKEREADFFAASRFRSVYSRPDVIDKILATEDETEAIRLANLESGRKEVEPVSVRNKLPPVLTVLSPSDGSEVSSTTVIVRFTARSEEPITSTKVLLDGRPISPPNGIMFSGDGGEFTITIPQRDCEISLIADNRHATSKPATVSLLWRGFVPKDEPRIRPRLYVLAVGVSQYRKPDMRLLLAAKDALDFAGAWTSQKGRLYSEVEVRVLTDAQATKTNILVGMQWLEKQVRSSDVAVLFFAGHGLDDNEGFFYFLPVEVDPENLKGTGLPQTDVVATVSAIAGKVLVFMDACHSGNLMGKTKRRGLLDVNSIINELAAAENGAIVFSSSTGRQYSLENTDWGNGAFTKGLVEGIGGKADYRGTGRITVNMLDLYISERVKELTRGEQTPSTVKPPNVPDFPLAVVTKSK